jgi:nicotinamide mononucleotide transporter
MGRTLKEVIKKLPPSRQMSVERLAQKKIETWYLWIGVDIVCVFLFYKKGIAFLALEYFVFLGLATYGLLNWKKQLNNG